MKPKFDEKVNEKFQSRTIAKVETACVNMWVFHFTDGTKQEVMAECGSGNGGFSLPWLELPCD